MDYLKSTQLVCYQLLEQNVLRIDSYVNVQLAKQLQEILALFDSIVSHRPTAND